MNDRNFQFIACGLLAAILGSVNKELGQLMLVLFLLWLAWVIVKGVFRVLSRTGGSE